MLLLLVADDMLLRLATVPIGPLGAVELTPGTKDPEGEMEPPAEVGTEPVGSSVLVALGPLVLARLSEVGPLELVALDNAYGWDEVNEPDPGLVELVYPADVPEEGAEKVRPDAIDVCDVCVENDVQVLAPDVFGTVSIPGAVES